MTAWEKRKGWLSGYKKRKQQPITTPEKVTLETVEFEPAVSYTPLKCPKCKSKNVLCYHSDLPVRYHRCTNCKCRFKSVEEDV